MHTQDKEIRLTQFARGAGCGCKVAPQVLQDILHGKVESIKDARLLVGYESSDDAAAYDLGNGQALISTTDFFTPVVDDPFDYGRAAAANALSDVYAMGGKPLMALAILGWPVEKLPATMASRVLDGARTICAEAGIVLAGGHTVDTPEPLFGLAVSGLAEIKHLKKNSTAGEGDLIFLTKPLGTGLFSTARKRDKLTPADEQTLITQLCTLNKAGAGLAQIEGVSAMTDVTGFGIMGHLLEMARGAGLTAAVSYEAIPKMAHYTKYLSTVPDATYRNWNAYEKQSRIDEDVNLGEAFVVLPDPQTNGGLLFTVRGGTDGKAMAAVRGILASNGLGDYAKPIGIMSKAEDKALRVTK